MLFGLRTHVPYVAGGRAYTADLCIVLCAASSWQLSHLDPWLFVLPPDGRTEPLSAHTLLVPRNTWQACHRLAPSNCALLQPQVVRRRQHQCLAAPCITPADGKPPGGRRQDAGAAAGGAAGPRVPCRCVSAQPPGESATNAAACVCYAISHTAARGVAAPRLERRHVPVAHLLSHLQLLVRCCGKGLLVAVQLECWLVW
jgi:hypothetical protein